MRRLLLSVLLLAALPALAQRHRAVRFPSSPAQPRLQTVVLAPWKDNTLYETTDGSVSDGAGPSLFAGMTAGRQLRRAVIAFDLTGIPARSQITRVTLTLHVSQAISPAEPMTLHRVTTAWGEGASNAGSGHAGGGAPSQPGDATWIHTIFSTQRWARPGGDFDIVADASASSGDAGSDTVFATSAVLTARVQGWADAPSSNFGWIVIGNETVPTTTKRFDSREVLPAATRPALTVEYTAPQ